LGLAAATAFTDAVALGQGAAEADALAEAAGSGADVEPAGTGADVEVPVSGANVEVPVSGADVEVPVSGANVDASAAGEAQLASADWLTCDTWPPLDTAIKTPRVTASATGMAIGTATRSLRLIRQRRRHADRCRVGMQSTSIFRFLS
jgi:hypothetical protein